MCRLCEAVYYATGELAATGQATCSAVGAWCHDQQIPCVYRAQPSPDVSPGVEGTEVTDTLEQIRVLRRLKPSCLTTRRHLSAGHLPDGVDSRQ